MLTLLWNLSAAIRGYLRFYMPTNIALDYLRTPRGLKWAVPVALVAVPAYLYVMSLCAVVVANGGPGYLNLLVILFFWNAMKVCRDGRPFNTAIAAAAVVVVALREALERDWHDI